MTRESWRPAGDAIRRPIADGDDRGDAGEGVPDDSE